MTKKWRQARMRLQDALSPHTEKNDDDDIGKTDTSLATDWLGQNKRRNWLM